MEVGATSKGPVPKSFFAHTTKVYVAPSSTSVKR